MTERTAVRWRPAAALALFGLALMGCAAGGTMPSVRTEGERLAAAREALDKGHYNVSTELLKTYVVQNAGRADVDQAIYMLGESYLRMREYASAAIEFERVIRDYPESDSSGAAAYQLGEAFWGQARKPDFDQEYTEKALSQWIAFVRDYPDHPRAPEAIRKIRQARTRLAEKLTDTGLLYMKLEQPEPARIYFERVITEYSDTDTAPWAEIGLAKADAARGRREEAIARLVDVETRWAGQKPGRRAAQERKRLGKH